MTVVLTPSNLEKKRNFKWTFHIVVTIVKVELATLKVWTEYQQNVVVPFSYKETRMLCMHFKRASITLRLCSSRSCILCKMFLTHLHFPWYVKILNCMSLMKDIFHFFIEKLQLVPIWNFHFVTSREPHI